MKINVLWLLLILHLPVFSIAISKTSVDFSIENDDKKNLRFSKELQSQIFSHFNYQDLNYGTEKVRELKEEIKIIEFLWNSGKDSINIDLKSASVGYPLQYKDILLKQIEVFRNDPKWQKYTVYRKNNKKPSWDIDHELIETIMLEGKVYSSLDDLLLKFGYKIKGFSVEKTGYVTQKYIDKYDLEYEESEIKDIPIPFIVWVSVEKIIQLEK
ncbi:MAG: hypothetical protein PF638_13260 [Candidatus Delongbacteria bacterium]|jgi:hypothetical protein|nr:hypothetical protein [Candidatus Delongbacteria bacterium]